MSGTSGDLDQQLEDLTRRGEAAYAKMYDCRPSWLSDLCDDAMGFFSRAAALATEAGRPEQARALAARAEHVRAVYWQLRT